MPCVGAAHRPRRVVLYRCARICAPASLKRKIIYSYARFLLTRKEVRIESCAKWEKVERSGWGGMSRKTRNAGGKAVRNAAGKPSSDSGRERAGEDTRRVSGRAAPVGEAILRDQREWRPRTRVSHENVGRHRAEASETFLAQSGEAEISGSDELLRSSRGA